MRDDAEELDADRLRELFQELSDRLADRGQQAQLFVVGGAAMALEYDGGRVTRDVDAVFAPGPEVRQLAEELSGAHGLEPDWINDAVKGFMPGEDDSPRRLHHGRRGSRVAGTHLPARAAAPTSPLCRGGGCAARGRAARQSTIGCRARRTLC